MSPARLFARGDGDAAPGGRAGRGPAATLAGASCPPQDLACVPAQGSGSEVRLCRGSDALTGRARRV